MSGGARRSQKVLGSQVPTHHLVPAADYSMAEDVFDMANLVGIDLFPWQRQLLIDGLGMKGDRWAAFEVAIEIARQNGKSWVLDLLALTALYTWELRTIIYSAHDGTTVTEAFERVQQLIKDTPALRAITPDRCFAQANGKERIKLSSGGRILFKTRTGGGGRGLSGDLVIADEAQGLRDNHIAALFPTLRSKRNPQIWYAGTAGNQESTVLGRLVKRIDAGDPNLCGWRFASEEDDAADDVATWVKVSPSLGYGYLTVDRIANEYRSLPPEKFLREIITRGDYPREDGEDWVIPASRVEQTEDRKAVPLGPVTFVADAHPQMEWASIAVAAAAGVEAPDGTVRPHPWAKVYGEVVAHERGVRWLAPRLKELLAAHESTGVVVLDPKGPLGGVVQDLEDLGVKVRLMKTDEVRDACSYTLDGIANDPKSIVHRGAPVLTSAIAAASTRPLAGGIAWRRSGLADVSPFYAFTFAVWSAGTWGARPVKKAPKPRRVGHRAPQGHRTPVRRQPRRQKDIATAGF